MLSTILRLVSLVPAAVTVIEETIAAVETAGTTEAKIHAIANGAEQLASAIRSAI